MSDKAFFLPENTARKSEQAAETILEFILNNKECVSSEYLKKSTVQLIQHNLDRVICCYLEEMNIFAVDKTEPALDVSQRNAN